LACGLDTAFGLLDRQTSPQLRKFYEASSSASQGHQGNFPPACAGFLAPSSPLSLDLGIMRPLHFLWGHILGQRAFVLNQNAGNLLENFFISAVVSILVIRLYIRVFAATPVTTQLTMRLATERSMVDLHFAHVLWGGLFMLAGIILALAFLGRSTRELAAILGGIGFGAFIDQLGKFITLDNDYFFQPAIALIYLSLVLFFIIIRAFQRPRHISRRYALANALEITKLSVIGDAHPEDRAKALALLDQFPSSDPEIDMVRQGLHRMEAAPHPRPHILERPRRLLNHTARQLVEEGWFTSAVIIFFVFQSLANLYQTLAALAWTGVLAGWLAAIVLAILALIALRLRSHLLQTTASVGIISIAVAASLLILVYQQEAPRNLGDVLRPMAPAIEAGTGLPSRVFNLMGVLQVVSPIISNVLVVIGILSIWHSRVTAYRLFQQSVLVSILLTQVFIFHEHQLTGVVGLAPNLVILGILRFLIRQEEAGVKLAAEMQVDSTKAAAGAEQRS
jgi:hypothetical protein